MDMLFANALFTCHRGQSGGRGLSPRLWSKAYGQALSPDGFSNAFAFYDNFMNFYPVTLTTAAGQLQPGGGYFAYIEADATVGSIQPVPTETGGVIKLLTSTDSGDGDNHDTVLTTQGNVGTQVVISDTAGSDKLLIFEARIKPASVTDGDGSIFVGLTEEGLGAADTPLLDDSGHTLSSDDMIGFAIFEDDNDALKFVYRKAGQAVQTLLTYDTALTAGSYIKVGFVYDPKAAPANRISVYVDNVEQSTYVTATNIAAATFPDGEELTLTAAIKGSANAAAQSFNMDWWALYQAGS
jgi:hypothetical protein